MFFQGIVPVVLRAFPTNAAALAVWEAVMRGMGAKEASPASLIVARESTTGLTFDLSNEL